MQPDAIIPANLFSEIPEFYMIVTQDNDRKIITIDEVNSGFADLLSRKTEDLVAGNLRDILAASSAEVLDDIEFASDAPDFFDVFSKQRLVKWQLSGGEETSFPLHIMRIEAMSSHVRFKISVPDERSARAKEQLSSFLKANFESRFVADRATGLANRETCIGFFDSLIHFVHAHDISVAFATIRIDRFPKSVSLYGEQACNQLIGHVARGCRRALAPEDVVARLNDEQLALFMFNVSRESARVILNRLRWLIRSHRIVFGGKSEFSVTVSFAFNMLGDDVPTSVMEDCEKALKDLPQDDRNRLIELAA